MGNGTFCPSLLSCLLFGGGVGGGVGEGLLFHFILFKIADYRGSAIFVAYCTLKTRWKYDRPPTDHRNIRESVSRNLVKSSQVSNSPRTWIQKIILISRTYLFKDRSPWNVVGGISNDMQKCFHAIFPSTCFIFLYFSSPFMFLIVCLMVDDK